MKLLLSVLNQSVAPDWQFSCGTIERSPSGPWPQFRERVREREREGCSGGEMEGIKGKRDKEMLCQNSIRAAQRSVKAE